VYLAAAAGLPLKRRIVHAHNADEAVPTPNRLKQRILREPMRRTCLMLADRIVGNSHLSLQTFLGGQPCRGGRDSILYYGVDPTPFCGAQAGRDTLRRELDLPADARILLFAGRMVPEKNPLFAVDALAALHARDSRVSGVFVGDGALALAVRERAIAKGLEDAVRFLGWRGDVPRIMAGSDWFILPHPEQPSEGFGIAVVEAQLAGLPLLLSLGVTDAPLLPTASFRRLPLSAGPDAWAVAAVDLAGGPRPSARDAIRALAESPMEMDRALDALLALHA
jgi:glycosyltransferase involved in cell wall biosynthesis